MNDFSESLDKLKFDKRMVKWNLNKKVLTEKEYKKHLDSLKDISHLQAEPLKEKEENKSNESKESSEEEESKS